MPECSRKLTRLSLWLPAIKGRLRDERLRVDCALNIYNIARGLIRNIHVTSRTTMPGWAFLMTFAEVGRSTVIKALAWLRSRGFLGTVASGRKGIYAQKGADGHELYPSSTGERTNERAVYVLCMPLTEAEKAALASSAPATVLVDSTSEKLTVDISRSPIPTSVGTNPPHAREEVCDPKNGGASPRQTDFRALSERGQDSCGTRRQPLWSGTATTNAGTKRATRANELVAALTLRNDNFALRPLSGRHLAYLFRPCFEADWTINDIKHALDHKPDGSLHRHDGFDGAKNVANLIAYRLGFWIENGLVTYSRSQRVTKRAESARQRAIEYTRAMERKAKEEAVGEVTGWSDRAKCIIQQIRGMFH